MKIDEIKAMKNFFKNDKFVELAGIEITEITEKQAVVSAEIKAEHLNANGCVQGGMLYTLADFAFAVLGNFLHPITVTQCGHINYLRPAFTNKIVATAKETERAGKNTLCEVVIRDDSGKTVCICNFNGFIKETDRQELLEKYAKED